MLGKHSSGSRDARERRGHKQYPPGRPLRADIAAATSVGEPLPTRVCGGDCHGEPRAVTHVQTRRGRELARPLTRAGEERSPSPPAASRPRPLLSVTFPPSAPCVLVRGVCARVLVWARVRRRGHPGRPCALRCQETFRSSWSCHRSRRGQGPVAPEQSRPVRTPPTGLAATLCGRGSRSTSRVTGPVGVARNARIPPDSHVCCPAPPGQASGPDSRGLEGKAVRNPPSLVLRYQTPSAPR